MEQSHFHISLDSAVHNADVRKAELLSKLFDVNRELEHLALMYDGRKHPDFPDSIFIKLPDADEKKLRMVKWDSLDKRFQVGIPVSEWDKLERIPLFEEPNTLRICLICGQRLSSHKPWIGTNDSVTRSKTEHSNHIAHHPHLSDSDYYQLCKNEVDRVTGEPYFDALSKTHPLKRSRYF
jgi:hypothetical protein